jgi:3-hydroxyisobutyrate dehydrogenase-like beta-hydroxyacid dehydrogenase
MGRAAAGPGEDAMRERLAFLCLGAMGGPMAGHLAAAGHDVVVWNRTGARADAWVGEHGGRAAASPAEAAAGAAFVFVCSGNDDDLRSVTLAAGGAVEGLVEGSVLIDHTTVSASLARELEQAARAVGAGFLDAPVSGGEEGARRGQLTVMVGGEPETFERARPLLSVYARQVARLGPAGAGQLTKMVNQICIAGVLQGLSEGLVFAEHAGLEPDAVVEVISKGAAQSWQMDQRAGSMIEGRFDFGFAVDWMRKDLAIAMAEAERNGAPLPVARLVDAFYAEVQAAGGGRLDTSSLITRLRDGS